jgi:ABC-type phosphate transport system ATPase subunit
MVDKIIIENLSLQYSDGTESLRDVSLGIREKAVTVLFGPAGGGKSTLLRCLNRLNDLTEVKAASGRILIDGQNILDPKVDVIALAGRAHRLPRVRRSVLPDRQHPPGGRRGPGVARGAPQERAGRPLR